MATGPGVSGTAPLMQGVPALLFGDLSSTQMCSSWGNCVCGHPRFSRLNATGTVSGTEGRWVMRAEGLGFSREQWGPIGPVGRSLSSRDQSGGHHQHPE